MLLLVAQQQPDVLYLQGTKVPDEESPADAFNQVGYSWWPTPAVKTYNGVAILSRLPANEISARIARADGAQKRLLVATVGDVRVVNVYVPNGEAVDSDKYGYKLAWLKAPDFLKAELEAHSKLVLLGDFNIAPEERDVHDPKLWEGHVLFSDKEREAFGTLVADGLVDVFRKFDQPAASFSWWDYRMGGFRRDLGLRIDHILASRALANTCRACHIDKTPRALDGPPTTPRSSPSSRFSPCSPTLPGA